MTTAFERRLAEFVDRTDEMATFCRSIETGKRPILYVSGDGGVGKTSLLMRMIHESAQKNLRKAEVTWTETRNHDYLATMRKIRSDLGEEHFNPFTDLVNHFTVPQYNLNIRIGNATNINVAEGASFGESSVGDMAGVIIKDSMIAIPRSDMAVPEPQRMERLTKCFIENFAAALAKGSHLIVFFDAVEKMSESTRKWVVGELFGSVLDGRLRNVSFVLCGRGEFFDDSDRDLKMLVTTLVLKPLGHAHIEEYLERRGICESERKPLAKMLYVAAKGNPLHIANLVDSFLEMN